MYTWEGIGIAVDRLLTGSLACNSIGKMELVETHRRVNRFSNFKRWIASTGQNLSIDTSVDEIG